jgi:hypothetical protein
MNSKKKDKSKIFFLFKNQYGYKKTAEFHADFKSVESLKKFPIKTLLAKT